MGINEFDSMLINFSEQIVNDFLIPSFSLSAGEIVVIDILSGAPFYTTEMELVNIFTGKQANEHVEVKLPLTFVPHFKESRFLDRFFPMTINQYHRKYANMSDDIYKKIYETEWISGDIKINTIAGNPKRKLSLYTTLSWTKNIILDLVGVDPQGGKEIYSFLKTIVSQGGAVILIDSCAEFKDNCTTFIKAKYIGDTTQIDPEVFKVKVPLT